MPTTEYTRWNGSWVPVESVGSEDISDNLIAHYDATTLGLSDGQTLSTWPDLVGSYTGTGASPTYRDSVQNGLPMVEFNNNILETGYVHDTTDPITVIAVASASGADTNHIYGAQDISGDGTRMYLSQGSNDDYLAGFADSFARGGTFSDGVAIVTMHARGGQIEVLEGTTSIATSSYTPVGSLGEQAYLGGRGTGGLVGRIGELVVAGDISPSVRNDEILRLMDKWGIS